jgi:hypothetical protein
MHRHTRAGVQGHKLWLSPTTTCNITQISRLSYIHTDRQTTHQGLHQHLMRYQCLDTVYAKNTHTHIPGILGFVLCRQCICCTQTPLVSTQTHTLVPAAISSVYSRIRTEADRCSQCAERSRAYPCNPFAHPCTCACTCACTLPPMDPFAPLHMHMRMHSLKLTQPWPAPCLPLHCQSSC